MTAVATALAPASAGPFPHVAAARPIELGGGVRLDPPFVLAPMEGVTHRVFRDLMLDVVGGPGAAWTEFLRVTDHATPVRVIRRELGPPRRSPPVGVQLMGVDEGPLAESARNAVAAGAPMVDLNFGCPAKIVFSKCAGSALLATPERVHALIAAVVAAVSVPVTAKVRLGTDDESRFDDIIDAVTAARPAALTVHARTKADGYTRPARWEFLARARARTAIPVIGNGDVQSVADAERMLAETGVAGVMIARGTLRDPWIFARIAAAARGAEEPVVGRDELLAFHGRYRDAMRADGARESAVLSQCKQLWRRIDVGVAIDDAARQRMMRARNLGDLDAAIAHLR